METEVSNGVKTACGDAGADSNLEVADASGCPTIPPTVGDGDKLGINGDCEGVLWWLSFPCPEQLGEDPEEEIDPNPSSRANLLRRTYKHPNTYKTKAIN